MKPALNIFITFVSQHANEKGFHIRDPIPSEIVTAIDEGHETVWLHFYKEGKKYRIRDDVLELLFNLVRDNEHYKLEFKQ